MKPTRLRKDLAPLPPMEDMIFCGLRPYTLWGYVSFVIPIGYFWSILGGMEYATAADVDHLIAHVMRFYDMNPDNPFEIMTVDKEFFLVAQANDYTNAKTNEEE